MADGSPAVARAQVRATSWLWRHIFQGCQQLTPPGPSLSSPVIVDQQTQAPIVPRSFPEEGVNQNDELQARKGDGR